MQLEFGNVCKFACMHVYISKCEPCMASGIAEFEKILKFKGHGESPRLEIAISISGWKY